MEGQSNFTGWGVVELMGHGREIGYVTTEVYGAACLFRIDTPELLEREYVLTQPEFAETSPGHRQWCAAGTKVKRPAVPARSRLVSPGALYALNPCSEEAARAAIEATAVRPLIAIDVPAGLIPAPEPEDQDNSLDDEDDFLDATESLVRGEGL